jgi:predicted TIM-barrel fold metal-dependent hydrolase
MRPKLANLPSFYFRRQCYGAFMYDPVGVHVGHHYGFADNMVWSSDLPHGEGTYGESRNIIKAIFEEMGEEEAKKVVGGNAAKLYGI